MELQAPCHYLDDFPHADIARHKELGFVQGRKLLLNLVLPCYHWDLGRMLLSDELGIVYSLFQGAALCEGLL